MRRTGRRRYIYEENWKKKIYIWEELEEGGNMKRTGRKRRK